MTVSASFTADVESGEAPLTVTFTDTSTGSPSSWLWDFGDGSNSDDQNPTHTYENDGTYSVTLTAFIISGTTSVWPSSDSALRKSGSGSTNATALSDFATNSWTNTDPFEINTFNVDRPGDSNYNYFARKVTSSLDLSGQSGKIIKLMMKFTSGIITASSGAKTAYGGHLSLDDSNLHTIGDLTSEAGNDISIEITDIGNYAILADVGVGGSSGWAESFFKALAYSTTSRDTTTKTDYINVGADPPVAAFSATPRKKKDSLTSVFTDESTNTPTSWSWKRRPSGILAPYVEFSTDENPSEDFDIESP